MNAQRIVPISVFCAILIAIFSATGLASQRRHAHRAHRPTPTSTATPSSLKPVVLIVGGAGFGARGTAQTPGVSTTPEIYDSAVSRFLPIASMNERRDQFAAAATAM